MPHSTLGEDVAAAVTLREGAQVNEIDLRTFAAQTLAHFKVPTRIVFIDEIPKGPTGKPQRLGLARKLGLIASAGNAEGAVYVAHALPSRSVSRPSGLKASASNPSVSTTTF